MGHPIKTLLSPEEYVEVCDWFKNEIQKIMTISDLADRIGIPKQELINRLNPKRHTDPFKFEHFLKIMDHLPGPSRRVILKNITSRWGFIPVRHPISNNKELTDTELFKLYVRVGKESGDVSKELLATEQDKKMDRHELKRILKEITDMKMSLSDLEYAVIYKWRQDSAND
jgi:hypothetical protein